MIYFNFLYKMNHITILYILALWSAITHIITDD